MQDCCTRFTLPTLLTARDVVVDRRTVAPVTSTSCNPSTSVHQSVSPPPPTSTPRLRPETTTQHTSTTDPPPAKQVRATTTNHLRAFFSVLARRRGHIDMFLLCLLILFLSFRRAIPLVSCVESMTDGFKLEFYGEQFSRRILVTSSPTRPIRATTSRGCYEETASV